MIGCCQTAPNLYLNQCWPIINEVLLLSPYINFTENAHLYPWYVCENYKFKITATSPRSLWINPDSKVHGANMGLTWVLSAPDGPHVGPMNLVIVEASRASPSLTCDTSTVITVLADAPTPKLCYQQAWCSQLTCMWFFSVSAFVQISNRRPVRKRFHQHHGKIFMCRLKKIIININVLVHFISFPNTEFSQVGIYTANSSLHKQDNCCWWPGDAKSQAISSHDINLIWWE